jgi:Ca2+-binding RTX toxin-like protein
MHRAMQWAATLGAVAGFLVLAPAALAAPNGGADPSAGNPFGCRASGLRVDLGGATPVEPEVANANTYPCHDVSQGVGSVSVPNGSTNVTGGPVGAFTYVAGSANGAFSYGAAAVASVQGIVLPTSDGLVSIVGPVEAAAGYECVDGQVSGYGQSTLDVIYVNGKKTFLPAPGAEQKIPLGSNGAYIDVNEKLTTPNSITERVLDVHLSNGTDIVVGEALVTQTGAHPCAGVSGTPPVLEICPPGSTLDVPIQECVIYLNGGKTIIYVSRPFQGPTGGTVMALSVARKRYHSPCLSGPGPKYALIATKRGGRVQGTPRSDRILALGAYERVAGLGGNDCIDGKGGHQKLFDGNGNDRVYASAGFNRIAVGNGNDYLNGRNGSDWITAGNGRDTIYGGRGNSRIDIGIGRDQVYGGPGRNRIWAAGDYARVRCGSGRHNTAFVRPKARAFAAAHGCQKVHLLR